MKETRILDSSYDEENNVLCGLFDRHAVQQSCSKDVEGVVSGFNDDDNREIHFVQNSIIKSFDQGTLDGEFTVTLGRLGNKGSYKVRIDILRQGCLTVLL